MTFEFECARCGVHVVQFGEEQHPENIYCAMCRWMDEQELDEADRKKLDDIINRHATPEGH